MKKILASLTLFASIFFGADIEVSDIYVKQTPPNAKATAVFLKIKNNSNKDIDLVNAKSNLSDNVELHTHLHKNGKMTMLKVEKITIKANSMTELKPGGDHIMLFDPKFPVTKDSSMDITLELSNGKSLNFNKIESKEITKKHSMK